jgi:hypothetical protein
MIEAESQAVLNTLTEHESQNALEKMAEALGTVHTRGRGLLRGRWSPVGPKLVFDQMAEPVPEIMDDCLYQYPSYSEWKQYDFCKLYHMSSCSSMYFSACFTLTSPDVSVNTSV